MGIQVKATISLKTIKVTMFSIQQKLGIGHTVLNKRDIFDKVCRMNQGRERKKFKAHYYKKIVVFTLAI